MKKLVALLAFLSLTACAGYLYDGIPKDCRKDPRACAGQQCVEITQTLPDGTERLWGQCRPLPPSPSPSP